METIAIEYRFRLTDSLSQVFRVELDPSTLDLMNHREGKPPKWTELGFNQCPNCPLDPETVEYCPLALSISDLVTQFDNVLSYDSIWLEVVTDERRISQTTSAQQGLSSLMGLIIAVSGCPHTTFLKPMARFHLPLANRDETVYRAVSMYLLAEHFRRGEGEDGSDNSLEGLKEIYGRIQKVNTWVAKRLRTASEADAPVNAIVILDTFAKAVPSAIEDSLANLKEIFGSYLNA